MRCACCIAGARARAPRLPARPTATHFPRPRCRWAKANKDRLYYEHVEREQAAALFASLAARRTTLASQKALRDVESRGPTAGI